MYLTGLTHRDELFDLIARWLNDDLHENDGQIISRIFLYEGIISGAFVIRKMVRFLRNQFGTDFDMERIRQKQFLRERLIQYNPLPNERTDLLVRSFRENPEYFFPRLPIDAVLFMSKNKQLLSIGRIKRLSRVAEKISFRAVDRLFQDIRAEARCLAENRANLAELPLSDLISPPHVMEQEFAEAEMVVADRFRKKSIQFGRSDFAINDILGFKIIAEPENIGRICDGLNAEPGFEITEIQEHTGNYNAVNLTVDMTLPDPEAFIRAIPEPDWSMAARRGLNPDAARRGFPDYLAKGSRTIRTEIILTTYPELMESEFGRSLHELRILRLRERIPYQGMIAQNVGYLIEYLLTAAISPITDISELPIKIYGRYLPETVRMMKCALFGNEIDGSLLNAFCLMPECMEDFCLSISQKMNDN